jgi:DNA-binding MurR/RpiR family transcriptional regulator
MGQEDGTMSEQDKAFKERVSEARKKGFTPSFNKVAEYIENNILKAALSTASQLARENDVDPATVVRMSQRLGYRGYPELRAELAASIVDETDIITGTELLPLLEGRRAALHEEKAYIADMIAKIDAEVEWIDQTIERCTR